VRALFTMQYKLQVAPVRRCSTLATVRAAPATARSSRSSDQDGQRELFHDIAPGWIDQDCPPCSTQGG